VRLYWFSQTIGPHRGLEDAVRALGLLNRCDVQLHLRGHWQQGYEARLRRLAAESGAAQDLIFSYEPAQPDEMVRLASAYDVGLALEPIASVNNDIAISIEQDVHLYSQRTGGGGEPHERSIASR
jgi:glycosyltransferase involved in cell wall biosynthesis